MWGVTVGKEANAPWLLCAPIFVVFVVPSNMIFAPLGAVGFVAMIIALLLFAVWACSVLWGLHDPIPMRNPVRMTVGVLWIASIASYVQMGGGSASAAGRASANRWILLLMAITGIVMVTAETVRSPDSIAKLVRAMVAGATACAGIALIQFVAHYDLMTLIRPLMIGMVDNNVVTTFQQRGKLTRVAGVTFSPIELGVVMAMVIPFAVWRALFDRSVPHRYMAWIQAVLIGLASVITISRSAILALVVVGVVFVPFLPRVAKMWSLFAIPGIIAVIFVTIPGFMATIAAAFTAGSSDPSIGTRVNNYPRVEEIVSRRPLLGNGPGTYIVDNALHILDNQYLKSVIELGAIGLIAIVLYFLVPAVTATLSAACLRDDSMRTFAGAVAAAGFAGAAASITFDSLSFPVFTLVYAFVAGLAASAWIIARQQAIDVAVGGVPN